MDLDINTREEKQVPKFLMQHSSIFAYYRIMQFLLELSALHLINL